MTQQFPRALPLLLIGCVAALIACSKTAQTSTESTTAPEAAASATAAASESAAPSQAPTSSASPVATVSYTDINGIFAQKAITDEAKLGAFESTNSQFKPNDPLSRGEYVKWLVTLNNVYFGDAPTSQFRLPEAPEQTFTDVPQSSPDWKYVQALSDAGFVVGVDATHFAPDRLITRQEMVAIKYQVDVGHKATPDPGDTPALLSDYVDRNQVSKLYITAIHSDLYDGGTGNIQRIWGKTVYLHPTQVLTRGEAAISLDNIAGRHASDAVAQQSQQH